MLGHPIFSKPASSLGRGGFGGGGGFGGHGGFGMGPHMVSRGVLHPIAGRANIESGFCGPNAVVGSDGLCHPVILMGNKKT